MGAGPSREEAPKEASGAQEQLMRPMEVTGSRIEDPKKSMGELHKHKREISKTMEEPKEPIRDQDKSREVILKTREDPKKPNEDKEKHKVTTVRAMEEPKKLKEEEKPKEVVTKAMIEAKKMPHKFETIIKDADKPLTGSPSDHIHSGIFLNNKKRASFRSIPLSFYPELILIHSFYPSFDMQKYWVDEGTSHNCFMVLARGLSITWSEEQSYWHWHSIKETSDVEIEVASLQSVCWLEIHGRLEASYLTPYVTYEVVFIVMLNDYGYGWDIPVNLRLTLADGNKQQCKEHLLEKPRKKWIELKVGELMINPQQMGEIEFSLFEYDAGHWKRGLVVKGAIIRPKK